MQNILQQLQALNLGQTVIITTTADEPPSPFFAPVEIISVDNFLVTVNKTSGPNPGIYTISIFDIASVTFQPGVRCPHFSPSATDQ